MDGDVITERRSLGELGRDCSCKERDLVFGPVQVNVEVRAKPSNLYIKFILLTVE